MLKRLKGEVKTRPIGQLVRNSLARNLKFFLLNNPTGGNRPTGEGRNNYGRRFRPKDIWKLQFENEKYRELCLIGNIIFPQLPITGGAYKDWPEIWVACPVLSFLFTFWPVHFCKKNYFWPVLWPVLISAPPVDGNYSKEKN